MSRRLKRITGNISVGAVLLGIIAVLVFSAASPKFLKNDAQLTAEANAHTPIVKALPQAASAEPAVASERAEDPTVEYAGATPALESWVADKHKQWVDFYLETPNATSYSIFVYTDDDGGMWAQNLEWNAPKCGEIEITVEGSTWSSTELGQVSDYVLGAIREKSPELQQITATAEDKQTVQVSKRSDDYVLRQLGETAGKC